MVRQNTASHTLYQLCSAYQAHAMTVHQPQHDDGCAAIVASNTVHKHVVPLLPPLAEDALRHFPGMGYVRLRAVQYFHHTLLNTSMIVAEVQIIKHLIILRTKAINLRHRHTR